MPQWLFRIGKTPLRFASNFVFCAICWMIVSAGDTGSLVIGLPTILAAGLLMTRLAESGENRFSIRSGVAFLGYFFRASIVSGFDVARRVLLPHIQVSPAFISFRTELKSERARVFFANAASLIPGTLSAGFDKDLLLVHVIDDTQDNESHLNTLEAHVAAMFREAHGETRGTD